MIGVLLVIVLIIFIIIIISDALSKKKKDTPSETYSDAHQLAENARRRAERQAEKQKNEPIVKTVSMNTAKKEATSCSSEKPRSAPYRPAPISREERQQLIRDRELQTMREAGVEATELPFSQIIYNTDSGYGGKLITYNKRNQQFYVHEFMWHIDDSIEYLDTKMCSPDEAAAIIQDCSHKAEDKAPALERIAELCGINPTKANVSVLIKHSQKAKDDAPAPERADDLGRIDPTKAENETKPVSEDDRKRIEAIAAKASFGFDSTRPTDRPQFVLDGKSSGTGPYHEEEYFGYDVTAYAYIFSVYVIAPMAYTGGWEVLRVNKYEIHSKEELQILENALVRRWKK